MKIIAQKLSGTLLVDGEITALLLDEQESEANEVFLAYALATLGPESHILPSVLLDDWGGEVKHLALYRWFRDNAGRFPRAEVFGFSPDGQEVQFFLRDLELYGRYPVYAAPDRSSPPAEWMLLTAVLMPDPDVTQPQPADIPEAVVPPLREGRVSWWRVPPQRRSLDLLDAGHSDPA
jgi:hypothetical protein